MCQERIIIQMQISVCNFIDLTPVHTCLYPGSNCFIFHCKEMKASYQDYYIVLHC